MSIDQLEEECRGCCLCALHSTRRNLVFGAGSPSARLMFVGEAPGQVEDETGVPFTGPAGKLLDDMLLVMGLERTDVYIANILKCRPPQNRDPSPEEQEACIGWLRRQTALIRPKLIVCLGRIAAGRLIHGDFKITKEHGAFVEKKGVLMTAIYHPAALLRDERKLPETFEDLKRIERKLAELS